MSATRKSASRPGRPAAKLNRDGRALLLAAAADLFAEQGVAATTYAMIARRGELTAAMVHYYFASRGQLLDAVVEERIAPFIASAWKPVKSGADPSEIIRGVVGRMLEGIDQMPWIPSIWMREVLSEGGLLRTRVLRHLPFKRLKLLGKAIARGQAQEAVNPILDPELIAFSTIGLVMLHAATAQFQAEIFDRKQPGINALRRHITGLLLNGLQPEKHARAHRQKSDN